MMRSFEKLTHKLTEWIGSPAALAITLASILLWALSGPFLGFSDTWQLIINTSTTVITMVLVIMVQATQNRESKALHVKLDEIIEGLETTSNRVVGVETESEAHIEAIHNEHLEIKEKIDD